MILFSNSTSVSIHKIFAIRRNWSDSLYLNSC
nr:MAG TPA: hypothetical protein [Caudoviricetes sp.]DAW33455.1 MAG TPA: hypothetical protein [Caudoviricetes sp.]DAZ34022.1 MAG TPA: hypothetical protein [Caudoviricetes sp.]DAZ46047.1 MAG TPA: hypothetical protein [Caudoviricetes sp.]DAZ78392.1 MAG TPA: hypothetical protein [Caudoviricetes sp.]